MVPIWCQIPWIYRLYKQVVNSIIIPQNVWPQKSKPVLMWLVGVGKWMGAVFRAKLGVTIFPHFWEFFPNFRHFFPHFFTWKHVSTITMTWHHDHNDVTSHHNDVALPWQHVTSPWQQRQTMNLKWYSQT